MTTSNPNLGHREFQRILLIKPSSLGDIVHALPVLHGLRQRYPEAHLAWLVGRSFVPLLAKHPELNEVIEFDRHRFGHLWRSARISVEFVEFVKALRRRRFDLAIDLQGLFRSGFFALASGAPTRLGFAEARELARVFYTHRLHSDEDVVHAVDRNYLVADALGFAHVPKVFDLAVTDAERAGVDALFSEVALGAGEAFAAIFPGARAETKQWLPERFAKLADRLAGELGLRPVLMGGPGERDRCQRIAEQCRSRQLNLCGRTDLRLLAAVLERAAVVICHDSGPMHIAAALDRPMACILGPTEPRRTGPFGRMEAVVRANLPCSPCFVRRLSQCKYRHECMHRIGVEDVLARVQAGLQSATSKDDTHR